MVVQGVKWEVFVQTRFLYIYIYIYIYFIYILYIYIYIYIYIFGCDVWMINCWEEESRGSSRCMFQSSIIMNSCGEVVAEDRKMWNSSRQTLMGWEYTADAGGSTWHCQPILKVNAHAYFNCKYPVNDDRYFFSISTRMVQFTPMFLAYFSRLARHPPWSRSFFSIYLNS